MVVVVLIKVNAFSAGGSTSANGQSSSSNNGSENSNVIRFSDIICFIIYIKKKAVINDSFPMLLLILILH